jgi:hypothetical protein
LSKRFRHLDVVFDYEDAVWRLLAHIYKSIRAQTGKCLQGLWGGLGAAEQKTRGAATSGGCLS